MDVVLLKESAPYISESLARVTNKSLELGVFEQDWKNAGVSESRLFIKMMVTSMAKTITVQYVIGHKAKIEESLVGYQIIDFFGV